MGREEEIATLMAAYEHAGQGAMIVGVRGMGGVGKTELAKALAKRLKDHFPDGQLYFNLRGASDDDATKPATAIEALSHVIRSFEPEAQLPEDVDTLRGKYNSVLDGKRVLLLMDNALDAGQLAPLTPPPDGCALIVTSRQKFTLAGMESVDLDTLPPEEARKLLLKICPRIGDEANALAKRSGYLPLALRLAASALATQQTVKVEDYLADLSAEQGRLAALDEYRDMTEVERGIGASLGISYTLLNEEQQRFWRALSVFPGGFDALAAARVGQSENVKAADKTLGALHAASMVQWDEATGRFRLHDLARDYSRDQLSEAERTDAELRHAMHYLAVLRRADELYLEGGEFVLQGLALFDREQGNIVSGQAWAANQRETNQTAAKLCDAYPDAGIYCLELRFNPRLRIVWIKAAVEAARTLKNRQAECNHLGNLGIAHNELNEPRKAIKYYEKRSIIAKEIGYRRGEGNDLGNLGDAYSNLGEIQKAIECHKQSIVKHREIRNRRGELNSLGALGNDYGKIGASQEAIEYYKQALVISQEIGDQRGEGAVSNNIAGVLAKLDHIDEAIAYAEKAVEIYEQIESPDLATTRAQLERLRKQRD
ncbi:MAG: tetratricopeptide repeat protein [Candidatus Hydrogenedentes bacterium]|nr:tetratricopeptide repeat protein [Candidatus Hydrogenedentota bacterium]